MLNSHGHWSLWHRLFVPESQEQKENTFFQKFLEIVCIWKMHTRKEKCISKMSTGKEKCIPKMRTGKEFYSQILYRKRKWLSNTVRENNLVPKTCYPQNILIKSHEFSRGTFGSILLVTLVTLVTSFTIKRDKYTHFVWVPIF
jgi:hypothetical protein